MKEISTWNFSEISRVMQGKAKGQCSAFVGVSTDTRKITPGVLFVALQGENFDGHDFIEKAQEAGAAACVVSREVSTELPTILVEDTLVALQKLAHAVFERARSNGLRSIAITGSNGKTTVKEMIGRLLSQAGLTPHITPGNYNNHIGLPLTICDAPVVTPDSVWVLEMGANKFGDISELTEIAPADVRVITSIGAAHLEALGDLDGVRKVKSEIFEFSGRSNFAVVPYDERDRLHLSGFQGRVFSAGLAQNSDFRVAKIEKTQDAQRVEIEGQGHLAAFESPLPGRHNAANLAISLAAVSALGLEWWKLGDALSSLELPGERLRWETFGHWRVLNDAYNANPTSMEASYEAFLERATEPSVAVIGDMNELGPDAVKLHRQVARGMASRGGVTMLLFVGRHANDMADAAIDAQTDAEVRACADPESAVQILSGLADRTKTWCVFLKASRGARLERVVELMKQGEADAF